ncbi:transposase, partial [Micrococcus luteus]|uniref:transposase n=1 Tax=Micrococcus luteus TaxID=1270 RepID=UPI003450F0F0
KVDSTDHTVAATTSETTRPTTGRYTTMRDSTKKVPDTLEELGKLGRTLTKRAADVLAFFERLGTSNGPTEAINGRLEHLRGSALGFRNLTNYIARSLLESGGFRPLLHPQMR